MSLKLAGVLAIGLGLCGCGIPGHTSDPALANKPLPVAFYSGRVVSVIDAALGLPRSDAAINVGVRPFELVGAHVRGGPQPAGGRASITVGGVDVGAEAASPAAALEYTVALDKTAQIVQITQYRLAEDYQLAPPNGTIPPGSPVVIRMVGTTARVMPLSLLPPEFHGRIAQGPLLNGRWVSFSSPRGPGAIPPFIVDEP